MQGNCHEGDFVRIENSNADKEFGEQIILQLHGHCRLVPLRWPNHYMDHDHQKRHVLARSRHRHARQHHPDLLRLGLAQQHVHSVHYLEHLPHFRPDALVPDLLEAALGIPRNHVLSRI